MVVLSVLLEACAAEGGVGDVLDWVFLVPEDLGFVRRLDLLDFWVGVFAGCVVRARRLDAGLGAVCVVGVGFGVTGA